MKKENGSITLYMLISMIFLLTIAFTAYTSAMTKLQAQNNEVEQIKENYEQDLSTESLEKIYGEISKNEKKTTLPDGLQEVEYIESTGTQFIDTGVNSSTHIQTNFDFEYTELNTSYNRLFGTTWINGSQYGVRADTSQNGYFYGELISENVTTTINLEANKRYKIRFNDNNKFIINNYECNIINEKIENGTQNIYLFTHNGSGANPSKIKLYSCSLYDESVIIRNFIPCISTTTLTNVDGIQCQSGTIGLYDTIEGKLYTNKGTGNFIAGNEV